jgi:NAD(P)-dependent dehydrogenase (short-subunit alcohol dehydrogenase family)
MPLNLQGKVTMVTDGGSGIGRATALKLAMAGAKVMIADYMPECAEKVVKAIREATVRSSQVPQAIIVVVLWHLDFVAGQTARQRSMREPVPQQTWWILAVRPGVLRAQNGGSTRPVRRAEFWRR